MKKSDYRFSVIISIFLLCNCICKLDCEVWIVEVEFMYKILDFYW